LRDLPFDDIELCIYEQLGIGYKLAVSLQFEVSIDFYEILLKVVFDFKPSIKR